MRCPRQTRVSSGPPELAAPEKTGFGGKHLGRKTDKEMPAGKAGFREFETAGGVLIEADRSNYRPVEAGTPRSANCRAGVTRPRHQVAGPCRRLEAGIKPVPPSSSMSKSRNQKLKGRNRRPSEGAEKAGPVGRQPAARKWRSAARHSRSGWGASFNPKPNPKLRTRRWGRARATPPRKATGGTRGFQTGSCAVEQTTDTRRNGSA